MADGSCCWCSPFIAGFYTIFGAVKLHEAPTGRMIPRFSRADQVVHWSGRHQLLHSWACPA